MSQDNANFSPSALLSTPRLGPALPNSSGTLVLHTVSTYSFETHAWSNEICLKNVETGKTTLVINDERATEPNWLGVDDVFLYLQSEEGNNVRLIVGQAKDPSRTYVAGQFAGPVSGLKLQLLDNGTIAFLISGQVTQSGDQYNPANNIAKHSSGRLYTSLPVRKWDSYVIETRNTLFFGTLQKFNGHYDLVPKSLRNVLKALPGLECPIPPFGDLSQYDISKTGIVFISKDPNLNPAISPASHVYLIPLTTFTRDEETVPQKITGSNLHGASSSPVFSPDGKSVAFLKMKGADYESDKNRIILLPAISQPEKLIELFASEDGSGAWDRSPSSITWGTDGKELLTTAEERGRVKLFKMSVEASDLPVTITEEGCVSSVKSSAEGETQLFVTSSTFTEPCRYTILDASLTSPPKILYSSSLSTVSPSQVSEIWYPSTDGESIHAFVVTPKIFDPSRKYPVIFLIHGGPQYAWHDDFPIEGIYNPLLFAARGYIVFLPNITGSTGYGQAFTDSICGQWSGKPYLDLENGFNFVKNDLPYADTKRAVALGGSWGGYMVNWLAGQPLRKEFKGLVCDGGIFSTKTFASATDEGWFPKYDFEGHWWAEGKKAIKKWDPSSFVRNWATPMLIIHNERDFRHPITEGVAAFNALQERGIESAFLTFEDEGHMAVQPENMLVLYKEVFRFLNRFAGLEGNEID